MSLSSRCAFRRLIVSVPCLIAVLFAGSFGSRPACAAYGVPVPSQLRLTVRETAGIARTGEVVRTGVPMPRSLNLKSINGLAVVDSAGQAVPADFRITARWNAPLSDATAPIQWLLVSFPATVGAGATGSYRIVTDGSVANPAPARPLHLTQSGNLITVDTGAAIFRLGSNPGALFDEVVLDNGTRLIGGGSLTLRSNGAAAGHPTTRKVWVEHAGPLFASVVVTGAYDLAPVGNGGIGSIRRYVFTAGSATAIVRHAVAWEGNLACNGCTKTTAGTPNGVRLDQVRDTLSVELGGAATVTAVGGFAAPAVARPTSSGQTAEIRQLLRGSRTEALRYSVNVAGTTASGVQADGGVLAASGPAGAVAIALDKMHRYEPQALRRLGDGSLAIDVADDRVWLAHHQGLFGTLAVGALAPNPSRSALDRLVWAPLNRPLRAWADAAWFAASGAVEEFPVGALPAEVASYDTLIPSVLTKTVQKVDELGLAGLTTFGVYPRYWGKVGAPGEIDCGTTNDPTPGEAWDDKFWCGTWTDYHNTASTIPVWAMRTGDVEWLDELAQPAALRMLHTTIMQCSPTEKWFYCGQAPAGYGGYRADFNSSHAYLDNLYLHYWLTGDSVVLHILQRGADTMRRFMCDTRGSYPVLEPAAPGAACGPDHPSSTSASFTGRVATQWINAFRFLGLASADGSFLEDYRGSLARAATQHYVEVHRAGQTTSYGFLGDRAVVPGTYIGGPVWMFGFYDTNTLFRLLRDTNDAPIGNPALPPSRILSAVARTLKDIEPTVIGDGTVNGDWPKNLQYTYQNSRIGGVLSLVVDNDRPIFTPEKTSVTSLFLRAGELTNDSAMTVKGKEMALFTLQAAANENAPLGKLQGQYLSRLHAAVARLTNNGGSQPPSGGPVPAAPSAHAAQTVSASEIQLSWTDNANNEETFRVEQSSGGSAFQEVRSLPAGTTGVRISGLAASTAYSFRVRAANLTGLSGYSNTASATTSAPPQTIPTAPSALISQTVSASEIQLFWTDTSNNEQTFRVEQSTSGGAFQQVQSLPAGTTGVRISGLGASTAYSFRVRAANAAGLSGYSNTASATTSAPPPTIPAAPSALTAQTVSASEIQLSWTAGSNNEETFRVEQSTSGGAFQEVQSLPAGATGVRISGLGASTAYSFRVRAANVAGLSGYSNTASAATSAGAPAAPSNLTAQALSTTEIQLNWQDNAINEDLFLLEKSTDGVNFSQFNMRGVNTTAFKVVGLTAGTTYSFRVRAKNAAGTSAYSNPATATTLGKTGGQVLAAPANLRAQAVSQNAIVLTWQDRSSSETEFRIERLVGGRFQEIRKVSPNQTTARITGLAAGTTFTFRVRAANATSTSQYSNRAGATTKGRSTR
jgi:fibronectin type 3 domain-containing protein